MSPTAVPSPVSDGVAAASTASSAAPSGNLDGFAALGLDEALLAALRTLGYEEPTPIQRESIPPLLAGRDLLGQAATGTGKTAAFALPLLQRCARSHLQAAETDARTNPRRGPAALVLVPTRELAVQVAEAAQRYGQGLGLSVLAIYGGASMVPQLKALARGVDVVIATPGRALDHLRRGTLHLDGVGMVVLDEADEMLDMGFAEDLEALLSAAPAERQTALFSATLPPRIAAIANRHLREPARIQIAREKLAAGKVPRVRQTAYVVTRPHKVATLVRVLDVEQPGAALVFCRTRDEVDQLAETLTARGHRAEALHGGLSQEQRDRVMKRFRAGAAALLVATDVAARGLDIEQLSHVVNYDVPSEPESYVHRIGRTGRAGREGVAITLIEPREQRQLRQIEAATRQKIDVATVPTVAELRAHRRERLRTSLRETILTGQADGTLDEARAVVASLVGELDVLDVAAAAIQQLRAASAPSPESEQEIPAYAPPRAKHTKPERAPHPSASATPQHAARHAPRTDDAAAAERSPKKKPAGKRLSPASAPTSNPRYVRLYIGAGRQAKLRPGDLVGAITGESGLTAKAIGAIEIGDSYSLVEVVSEQAEHIVSALRGAYLKGRRVTVRRERQ